MTEIISFKNVSKRFVLARDRARSWQDIFVGLLKRRRAANAALAGAHTATLV